MWKCSIIIPMKIPMILNSSSTEKQSTRLRYFSSSFLLSPLSPWLEALFIINQKLVLRLWGEAAYSWTKLMSLITIRNYFNDNFQSQWCVLRLSSFPSSSSFSVLILNNFHSLKRRVREWDGKYLSLRDLSHFFILSSSSLLFNWEEIKCLEAIDGWKKSNRRRIFLPILQEKKYFS